MFQSKEYEDNYEKNKRIVKLNIALKRCNSELTSLLNRINEISPEVANLLEISNNTPKVNDNDVRLKNLVDRYRAIEDCKNTLEDSKNDPANKFFNFMKALIKNHKTITSRPEGKKWWEKIFNFFTSTSSQKFFSSSKNKCIDFFGVGFYLFGTHVKFGNDNLGETIRKINRL